MVTAFVCRKLGRPVNRKRVLRVMRERKLIQRRRRSSGAARPGFFRVERPGQLWHLDMTSVWVAEHGWVYLNAIIDCCTREIVGWGLETALPRDEAIAVIEHAVREQRIEPGELTLGTDNGSAFTARASRDWCSPGSGSATAAAVTATPSPRRSSSHGSETQGALRLAPRVRDARPGPGGDRRLHRPLPPPAPQPGSTTAPPPRSDRPGTMPKTHYKKRPPEPSTRAGERSTRADDRNVACPHGLRQDSATGTPGCGVSCSARAEGPAVSDGLGPFPSLCFAPSVSLMGFFL